MRHSGTNFILFCISLKMIMFIWYCSFRKSEAAEIRRLSVPRWVRNGTIDSVVLDCDYIYNENDLRLVVKWFFEDNFEPVYQWIPALNRKHTSGVLKNRLDLNFSVNTVDPYSKYRALRILKPSIELSGKYTCLVTSLAGQDSKEQVMTVFVPVQYFELGYKEVEQKTVNVTCEAWHVFPFPQLRLFLHSSSSSPPQAVSSTTYLQVLKPSGAYDVMMYRTFKLVELKSNGVSVFECMLDLPGTNYTRSKRVAYFPGTQRQKIGFPHGLSSSSMNFQNSTDCILYLNMICALVASYIYFSVSMRNA